MSIMIILYPTEGWCVYNVAADVIWPREYWWWLWWCDWSWWHWT